MTHTSSKASGNIAWWNAARLSRQEASKYGPLALMLIDHGLQEGKTLHTGVSRGSLHEADEEGQQELVGRLEEVTGGTIVFSSGPIMDRGTFDFWIAWEEGAVSVQIDTDHRTTLHVATFDPAMLQAVGALAGELLIPDEARKPLYVLGEESGRGTVVELGLMGVPFNPDHYTDDVADEFEAIVNELQSPTPNGRLAILQGPPGTGKTFLIRSIIDAIENAAFLFLPAYIVEHLAGPKLIQTLVEARTRIGVQAPLIIIIEDAERCLIPKDDNTSERAALSALLNASDGIVGHALNTRIICTMNSDIDKLDEAILRDRRLLSDLYVGPLPPEKAAALYESLTTEEVELDRPYTLAEIYRAAADGGFFEEGEIEDEVDENPTMDTN